MIDKHQIICNLYADAVSVSEIDGVFKAYDKDGKEINIVQSNIDAEYAKVEYKDKRTFSGSTTYAPTGEQMAMLYDDIIAGKLDATGSFAIHNKAVKDANPKP
tara:strand:- start:36 stop:344 length:309 start_codon:yes stop_codon:yes gene_type:complete